MAVTTTTQPIVTSPSSRRLRIPTGAGAVWAFTAVLAIAAVMVWLEIEHLGEPDRAVNLQWWALAIGFAVTELCVVHVHFRRGAHSLTLGEIPIVLGLVFGSPSDLAIGWVLGAAVVLIVQRSPVMRIAFNLAQFALVASLAAAVYYAAGGATAEGPALWGAVAAGIFVSAGAAPLLISAAMRLSGENVGLSAIPGMLAGAGAVAATNLSLGLVIATVLDTDPWSTPLLLAPCAAIFVAYRAYQSQHAKTVGLEFLYAASRTLNGAPNPGAGLAGVLAMALKSFRVEMAEAIVFGSSSEAAGAQRFGVGPDERVVIGEELPEAGVADVKALLGKDPHARVIRPDDVGPALARELRRLGVDEALVAALPGDGGPVGALFLANRLGVATTYTADDLRLFETLAGHTASTLGNDRLERRVAELRETQAHLEHQAFHDALTGLANRLLFHDRVEHALSRRSGNAAVIYIDLNDFKPVNDTLGHDAGDELLKITADRLRDSLRTADTPARLGGDEFAVLLTDIEPDHLPVVANRIINSFAEPFPLAGQTHAITASIGIALADCGSMTGDELLRNADAAMYVTKHGGKRGYSIYGVPTVAGA